MDQVLMCRRVFVHGNLIGPGKMQVKFLNL
jgi:hypothetical protein